MTLSESLAAWLRRAGIHVGAADLPGPDWLVHADLTPLHEAARALERAGDEVDEVRLGLLRLLDRTAVSLGWSGDAAATSGRRAQRTGTGLVRLADLLRELSSELSRHAVDVDGARDELRRLVGEAEQHADHIGTESLANPLAALRDTTSDGMDRLTSLHHCAARIREVLADTEAGDHARASRVVDLGSSILDIAAALESDGWVSDVVPPGARTVLGSAGIV